MARLSAAEVAEKHARRTQAATQDYIAGVQRTTVAPGAAAAAKQAKMLAKVTESVNSGRWAANVRAVTLQDWQSQAINVGAGRIAQGVEAGKTKMQRAMDQILPAVDAARAKVAAMPDLTPQDAANRAATFVLEMSKLKVRK